MGLSKIGYFIDFIAYFLNSPWKNGFSATHFQPIFRQSHRCHSNSFQAVARV
jgi:hypothetical protein